MNYFTKEQLTNDLESAFLIHQNVMADFMDGPCAGNETSLKFNLSESFMYTCFMGLHDYTFAAESLGNLTEDLLHVSAMFYETMNAACCSFGNSDTCKRIKFIVDSAFARAKYDGFHEDYEFSIYEISILANISEQSIRNSISKKELNSFVSESGERLIEIEDLKEWMPSRKGFLQTKFYNENEKINISNMITVPIAADGTIFEPSLKRTKGFQIGKKGEERYFENFKEALAELNKMKTPYWRRPNVKGIPGIVKGIGWKGISAKEISNV